MREKWSRAAALLAVLLAAFFGLAMSPLAPADLVAEAAELAMNQVNDFDNHGQLQPRQLVADADLRAERALPKKTTKKKAVLKKTTKRKKITTKKRRWTTMKKKITTRRKSTTKPKRKTTTRKKATAKATFLRKSFPLGLKPPKGDPKFKNATKKAKGAALFHKNTKGALRNLVLQAAGGKAERRLGSDYTDLLADPAVRQAALLLLKEKVAAGSAPHRKRSASDVAIVRYSKSLARALGRAVVPLAYDLRTVGGFPRVSSVKDQGYCGSCVSFAAMAALESVMLVKSKGKLGDGVLSGSVSPDLSESNTFFCKWPGATCDTGYYLEDAAPLIASKGVIYEDCAPYTGAAPSPVCSTSCSRAPSGKFAATPLGNSIDDIKAHVYTYGAVMTSMAIYQDFMDWANGPACAGSVWRGTSKTGDPTGGHAVTIVGWEEDANGVGNWIVKNSWGDSWCDGGYFRIGYGADAFAGSGDTQGFSWTPAATDCTAQGLIRCGDGSCKSTASQCTVKPDPVCPTGQYKCPDGTCKTSALLCKSACPAGQVQCWNGKCRNNYRECIRDFSNRTVCSQYGLFTCLDGLCAPDPDVCRATCEDLGLYQCPDSSCTASPAFCKSCTDLGLLECPDTGECVLTADACPATCEANGQVTCPNLACADSAADCGTEECTDMGLIKCGLDGSCVADPEQCPSCESIGRYTCPAASDGDSVVVCSDDPALCPGVDGSCEAMDLVECDTEIGGYHLCAPTADMCPGAECPWEKPVVCSDGSCAEDVETCDYYEQPLDLTCEDFEWVTCADGTCAPDSGSCDTLSCSDFGMDECDDGSCVFESEFCGGDDWPF